MAINEKVVHRREIHADLSGAELKEAILEYVLKRSNIEGEEYTHRSYVTSSMTSTGCEYTGKCEITIELGCK
ncbi:MULTISPECIES: hypothetical protein [Acinetobacter calcoaceticus/baumannii complex]|uniref:hypothetical protein n=1 Tax=Acinetobacter calcoaceticus/baumannii complex TaxID=909768 RepID=UPI0022700F21|nr:MULTISPECIES: hypothetical protein [Acinetobacter calcoaceticus/baumannii complex]MDD9317878.1 hypothetical protein [Acinetobacter lactucae]